ncbi:MAG: ATP-dependent zinc metalloprotease FtsH [Chthonomonas sp.]|nr:ATP-dependent zinc metalloprotease FtsH [Chthonomonas sp.]
MVIVFVAIMLLNVFGENKQLFGGTGPVKFTTSKFMEAVDNRQVKDAQWQEKSITGKLTDGRSYEVVAFSPDSNSGEDLKKRMEAGGVDYGVIPPPQTQSFIMLASYLAVPILLLLAMWFFVIRPAQSGGNQAMNFGRSRAKRVGESGTKVTFDDVAGIDEAKQELFEIVDYLKNTKKYVALGAKIPKGILLTGPPGVGKTHLARAIAGEAGVPFYHISGSDFVEMFVGVGAARVRDLFETAKAHRPCLIFVDEIDAVGRQRGAGLGGGHDEREQTLNQLLVEMDGFDPNSGVIMIAATNRPDVLDPALLRPGRFDRQLVVDSPDCNGREAILKIHAKGKPLDVDVDLTTLARRTPGFTGADLANSLNEAALLAARRNKTRIAMADMNDALDRVMGGPERRSRVMNAQEREVIAYHEAGHAVVGELLEFCDPVHKVTILPRGMSLGSTWHLPTEDKFLVSEEELLDDITALLGGRVAEEVVYSRIYTGASNDLQRVSRIARAMVCQYGMSDRLGTLALGRRTQNPFLGRDYSEEQDYSEDVAKAIDEEVRAIVEKCHQRATQILTEHRDKLDTLVQELLVRETLNRDDFLVVMAGEKLPEFTPAAEVQSKDSEDESSDSNGTSQRVGPPRFEPA